MNITFGMIVFNGDYVLQEVIDSIYPYAHQILIAEGPVQFWQDQGYKTSNDGTNQVLSTLNDPEKKITVIHSQYTEKDDQCNMYMSLLRPDTDYIWNLDCDEVFKPEDVEKVIELLEKEKYTSVGFKSLTFYGGFDRYLTGFEEGAEFIRIRKVYPGSYWSTHRPPTIAHTIDSSSQLPEKHLDFNTLAGMGVRMYHYSYVFPDQVQQKVKYYKQKISKDNCIDDYFEKVYLPWMRTNDKMSVEEKYRGPHEFKPQFRGDCFTAPFDVELHPKIIKDRLSELQDKINKQMEKYKWIKNT